LRNVPRKTRVIKSFKKPVCVLRATAVINSGKKRGIRFVLDSFEGHEPTLMIVGCPETVWKKLFEPSVFCGRDGNENCTDPCDRASRFCNAAGKKNSPIKNRCRPRTDALRRRIDQMPCYFLNLSGGNPAHTSSCQTASKKHPMIQKTRSKPSPVLSPAGFKPTGKKIRDTDFLERQNPSSPDRSRSLFCRPTDPVVGI